MGTIGSHQTTAATVAALQAGFHVPPYEGQLTSYSGDPSTQPLKDSVIAGMAAEGYTKLQRGEAVRG